MSTEWNDEQPFRVSFAEKTIRFFGDELEGLQQRERAHAAGVVANTLAALAINQRHHFTIDGVQQTLGGLSEEANRVIESLVNDESVLLLHEQSKRMCEILRAAIMRQKPE